MRTITLLLCLGLAGCASANGTTSFSPDPQPAPAAAAIPDPPLLPGPAEPAPSHRSRAAKRKADTAGAEPWWQEGGVTREKINAMCWMKYENGRKDLPVEKRADLVNACVEQTLKEHPLQ